MPSPLSAAPGGRVEAPSFAAHRPRPTFYRAACGRVVLQRCRVRTTGPRRGHLQPRTSRARCQRLKHCPNGRRPHRRRPRRSASAETRTPVNRGGIYLFFIVVAFRMRLRSSTGGSTRSRRLLAQARAAPTTAQPPPCTGRGRFGDCRCRWLFAIRRSMHRRPRGRVSQKLRSPEVDDAF